MRLSLYYTVYVATRAVGNNNVILAFCKSGHSLMT
jgi:hypothetical protein